MNTRQPHETARAFARRCIANASDCTSEAIYAAETGQPVLGWLRDAYSLQEQALAILADASEPLE
jgi:hypothetical protein